MSTSVLDMVFEMLRRPQTKVLGYAATADAIGTNYVTDVSEWLHARDGDKDDAGKYIWRYNLTGDDAMKPIIRVDPSTGRAFVDGTYADVADTAYILIGVYPQDVIDCAWATQQKLYREDSVLLSNGAADMDMERDDVNYWDGTAGGSSKTANLDLDKVTTPAYVYSRSQALHGQSHAASQYTRSEYFTKGISGNREIFAPVIVTPYRNATVTLQFYDGFGGVLFGDKITITGESTVVVLLRATTPTGCTRVQIQIGLTNASEEFYVDSIGGPFCSQQSVFRLPETIDESFKLPFVRRASFADVVASNVYDAFSKRFVGDYINGVHFHVENYPQLANPNNIIFEDGILPRLDMPLFLSVHKSLWDTEPFTDIGSLSSAPFGKLMAYFMYEIATMLHFKKRDDPRWGPAEQPGTLANTYALLKGDEEAARPLPAEMPAREVIQVTI